MRKQRDRGRPDSVSAALLHQDRALASHAMNTHIGFADLDAERRRQAVDRLIERRGEL